MSRSLRGVDSSAPANTCNLGKYAVSVSYKVASEKEVGQGQGTEGVETRQA